MIKKQTNNDQPPAAVTFPTGNASSLREDAGNPLHIRAETTCNTSCVHAETTCKQLQNREPHGYLNNSGSSDKLHSVCSRLCSWAFRAACPSSYYELVAHAVRVQHLGQVDELQELGSKIDVQPHKVLNRAVRPAFDPATKSTAQLLQERHDNTSIRRAIRCFFILELKKSCCRFHVSVNARATNRGTTTHDHTHHKCEIHGRTPQPSTYVSISMNGCSPQAPEGRAQSEAPNTSTEKQVQRTCRNKVPTCRGRRCMATGVGKMNQSRSVPKTNVASFFCTPLRINTRTSLAPHFTFRCTVRLWKETSGPSRHTPDPSTNCVARGKLSIKNGKHTKRGPGATHESSQMVSLRCMVFFSSGLLIQHELSSRSWLTIELSFGHNQQIGKSAQLKATQKVAAENGAAHKE